MKAVKIILLSVGYTVSGLLFALVFLGQMLSWWRSGVLIGEPFGAVLLCIPLSVMLSRPWEELAFAPREDPAILAATERARARGAARMKKARSRKAADDDDDDKQWDPTGELSGFIQ